MPHITELRIGNYGPFGNTQVIPCRPLTLIYGPNNAGKSTILRALREAQAVHKEGFDGPYKRLKSGFLIGGFRKIWNGHIPDLPWETEFGHFGLCSQPSGFGGGLGESIGWEVATELSDRPVSEALALAALLVDGEPAVLFRSGGIQLYAADHDYFRGAVDDGLVNRGSIDAIREAMEQSLPPAWYEWDQNVRNATSDDDDYKEHLLAQDPRPRRWRELALDLPPEVRAEGIAWGGLFPKLAWSVEAGDDGKHAIRFRFAQDSPAGSVGRLIRDLMFDANAVVSGCLDLLTLDASPARDVPQGVVTEVWDSDVQSEYGRALKDPRVRSWLSRMGFDLEEVSWSRDDGKPGQIIRWRVTDRRTGATGGLESFGDGLGQLLPVLTSIARGALVFVKQPELHLHPALQAEVGDFLLEATSSSVEVGPGASVGASQLFVETHSEHILLRVMRRMRETCEGRLPEGAVPVTPDHVSVLYVEPRGADSIVHALPLNARGELMKPFPGGFFEEGLREVFS